VIGTQGGGNLEIRNRGRIFVGILGIGVSAFPLTRNRVLNIRRSEITKREIPLEESFGISAFQDPGSQGDSDLESRVSNSRFMKSRGRKPFQHFGNSGSGRYRR
jgi:hypothetical protein